MGITQKEGWAHWWAQVATVADEQRRAVATGTEPEPVPDRTIALLFDRLVGLADRTPWATAPNLGRVIRDALARLSEPDQHRFVRRTIADALRDAGAILALIDGQRFVPVPQGTTRVLSRDARGKLVEAYTTGERLPGYTLGYVLTPGRPLAFARCQAEACGAIFKRTGRRRFCSYSCGQSTRDARRDSTPARQQSNRERAGQYYAQHRDEILRELTRKRAAAKRRKGKAS